jgi:phosphonate transport system ATP-binding protein
MTELTLRNVDKTYGDVMALKGVSMAVGADELVALLGRSGSGKSTLLRCINRLIEPDGGEILFDGVSVTELGTRDLRRFRCHIGMIFQEFNLVNRLSVIDNVLSGRAGSVGALRCWFKTFAKEDVERAEELLDRVGLAEHRYKRADELSGGQRQRVGIARALMQEPRLLLADEPTASLDPEIGREIMELICEIARATKIPVLISMHDVALAKQFVERVVALKDGIKIFDGHPTAVDMEYVYKEILGEPETETEAPAAPPLESAAS